MIAVWGVAEIVCNGLPIRVVPCRVDAPPTLGDGESLRWLVCCEPIGARRARRLARERLKMIGAWSGGAPTWLQQRIPRLPLTYRRPIGRRWPNGQIDCFASIADAGRAVKRSRAVLHKYILNECADTNGCQWFDKPCAGVTP